MQHKIITFVLFTLIAPVCQAQTLENLFEQVNKIGVLSLSETDGWNGPVEARIVQNEIRKHINEKQVDSLRQHHHSSIENVFAFMLALEMGMDKQVCYEWLMNDIINDETQIKLQRYDKYWNEKASDVCIKLALFYPNDVITTGMSTKILDTVFWSDKYLLLESIDFAIEKHAGQQNCYERIVEIYRKTSNPSALEALISYDTQFVRNLAGNIVDNYVKRGTHVKDTRSLLHAMSKYHFDYHLHLLEMIRDCELTPYVQSQVIYDVIFAAMSYQDKWSFNFLEKTFETMQKLNTLSINIRNINNAYSVYGKPVIYSPLIDKYCL